MASSAVFRRLALILILGCLAVFASAAEAAPKTLWLCKPGLARNPCEPGLSTTVFSPSGERLRVADVRRAPNPRFDCFYVYPTVSIQPTPQATLQIDPQQRTIALYQTARFSRDCRVFAPIYRQITLGASLSPGSQTAEMLLTAYADVRDAWRLYLRKYNRGRGVVLIGHSQGAGILRRLIRIEIDPKPALRKRLISAILLGANVLVREGRDTGGDFKHIRACRSESQLHCVVAYSTFNGPVPANSLFGRTTGFFLGSGLLSFPPPIAVNGREVLCTNPAALGGGSGKVDVIYPSRPPAPGSLFPQIGFLQPPASTPWVAFPHSYRARCSSAGGANVLQVTPLGGAPTLNPFPGPVFGLHSADASIALGNLTDLVRIQAAAYAGR